MTSISYGTPTLEPLELGGERAQQLIKEKKYEPVKFQKKSKIILPNKDWSVKYNSSQVVGKFKGVTF